ncbi:hypothetical protein GCM10018966_061680 [Streptomyces yanii]
MRRGSEAMTAPEAPGAASAGADPAAPKPAAIAPVATAPPRTDRRETAGTSDMKDSRFDVVGITGGMTVTGATSACQ